jgi:predicted short-subunit dehydrogenase-like oxidoreductase (DUF2520 family)
MVVHIAGAGAAGTSVGRALRLAGRPLGLVACRSLERAVQRCQHLGGGSPTTLDQLAGDPDGPRCLLLVAVPDRAIEPTATALAQRPWPEASLALHLSGSVSVEALAPLRDAGFSVGSMHPLKSFVDEQAATDAPLRDIACALEGDALALAEAQALAAAVGARPFVLQPGGRAAWHAGAAHACNHLVALVDQALDLLERAGLDRDAGRAALLPLLSGTVENLRGHTPGQALTGPVVRGDADVVTRHLGAMSGASPDVEAAYRALARRALDLARTERDLDETLAARIEAALNGGQE